MKTFILLEKRNTLHEGAIIDYDEDNERYLYKGNRFGLSSGQTIYREDCSIEKYEVENNPDKFIQTDFFIKDTYDPEIKLYKEVIRMFIDNTRASMIAYLDTECKPQSMGIEHNMPNTVFNGGCIRLLFERDEEGNENIKISKKKYVGAVT